MSFYYGYHEYITVAEKRLKAQNMLKKLQKKNPGIKPITLTGKTLAETWWGKAWNKNLEKYADYENRIGRGRSYVRNDSVLDLQIKPGEVTSLVQGTRAKPYSIVVKIDNISNNIWKKIRTECEGKIESLQELLEGKFPKALSEIFVEQGHGLFPSPKEIKFQCSCPDWASMCKHVAATLYGIGTRLDKEPKQFFELRNAKMNDLITQAVKEKSKKMLEKAKKKTSRVIEDKDIAGVFGVNLNKNA
jgi:uncharacterized Zn finger protein